MSYRGSEEGRQLREPGGPDRGLVHVPGGPASADPGLGHPLAEAEEGRESRRRLHGQLQVIRIALLHEQTLRTCIQDVKNVVQGSILELYMLRTVVVTTKVFF